MIKIKHEWTDPRKAMLAALEELTFQIISLPNCEETALAEARIVRKALDGNHESLTDEWIIDALHQSSIDLEVNDQKGRMTNLITKQDIIRFLNLPNRSSEDIIQDTDAYYAARAYETHGEAIRDNTFTQWVSIGQNIEECPICADGKECAKHG